MMYLLKTTYFLLICCQIINTTSSAQLFPYTITVKPLTADSLVSVHSAIAGKSGDKILMIGGRLDGLHKRQPFAAFDIENRNLNAIVINVKTKKCISRAIDSLESYIYDQLVASNHQCYQLGNKLYACGGYGYSASLDEHHTFDRMLVFDIDKTIAAIENGTTITNCFQHVQNPIFQVTGGNLHMLNNQFYLIGGHVFEGRYNPNGPEFGPGFNQIYSNQIRVFELNSTNNLLQVVEIKTYTDTVNLHRRDYNLVAARDKYNHEYLDIYSGVFQYGMDLPYMNAVRVDTGGYHVLPHFAQYYNHYSCPVIPLYSTKQRSQHHIFLGGIAHYYDSIGIPVQNNNVPHVKTICNVVTNERGSKTEYLLESSLDEYYTAVAQFIKAENIASYQNGVIQMDSLIGDTILTGYIIGGIKSDMQNTFWETEGEFSRPYNTLREVYLIKNEKAIINPNLQSVNTLQLQVNPNIKTETIEIYVSTDHTMDVYISLSDESGKLLDRYSFMQTPAGRNKLEIKRPGIAKGAVYILQLNAGKYEAIQKLNIEM
ncbi:MAG: hypothetical protein IPO27_18165 [Bacteroidetes bacterium]|nr:hypothetical protein [Bacteroidota bacterium]